MGGADVCVTMDVIEHIPTEKENIFMQTIYNNLVPSGFAVIGTPNVTMFPHASEFNRVAHINNYDQLRLYELASKYFEQVFIFGMNDEIVNTGFYPMSCYIIALCCQKKTNGERQE